MEPNAQLAVIIPLLTEIVDDIDADQLENDTACANFTVAEVLEHMMDGAAVFAPAFRGEEPQGSVVPAPAGSDTAAAFRRAMTDLLDAVNAPGALECTIDAPFGQVPGSVFARFVAFDGLVHGWDLASATGQAYDPQPEVVVAVDAFAREMLGPEMRDGDTFAAETTAPEGASVLQGLVAFSGRTL